MTPARMEWSTGTGKIQHLAGRLGWDDSSPFYQDILILLVLIGFKVHQCTVASVETVNAEKQFINTHQEALPPSKLVVSDKIRQQGGGACLRGQDNSEMLM